MYYVLIVLAMFPGENGLRGPQGYNVYTTLTQCEDNLKLLDKEMKPEMAKKKVQYYSFCRPVQLADEAKKA